eukprot:2323016-Amphidinium_carterae.1
MGLAAGEAIESFYFASKRKANKRTKRVLVRVTYLRVLQWSSGMKSYKAGPIHNLPLYGPCPIAEHCARVFLVQTMLPWLVHNVSCKATSPMARRTDTRTHTVTHTHTMHGTPEFSPVWEPSSRMAATLSLR